MEFKDRKSISDKLSKYTFTNDDSKFIEVTEWANGEGWDIIINDKMIVLSDGELDAINYLVKALQYKDDD